MDFKSDREKLQLFNRIFEQYFNPVSNSIRHFTRDANCVEDIVQETFILVFKKLHMLKEEAKAKSWVSIIAYNAAKRYMDKNKSSRLFFQESFDAHERQLFMEMQATSVEELVENKETRTAVIRILDELEYNDKQMVIMKYYFGMSYREIGNILEIDLNKLRFRMPGVLRRLKKNMGTTATGKWTRN